MFKFEFSVLTRDGQKVDRILIAGKDQADAERKLRQMYHHCRVIFCEVRQDLQKHPSQTVSVEELLSLIANADSIG